ncbi:hypothetical protein F4801DRAFT_420956 [Xylaria longipes]|nr:hypothetical protein F4801DRAFT_420956 [Xylaria longipes]
MQPGLYIGLLNCRDPGLNGEPLGIYLVQLGESQYARVDTDELWTDWCKDIQYPGSDDSPTPGRLAERFASPLHFYIRPNVRLPPGYSTSEVGGFLITHGITGTDIFIYEASPSLILGLHVSFIPILAEGNKKQACF